MGRLLDPVGMTGSLVPVVALMVGGCGPGPIAFYYDEEAKQSFFEPGETRVAKVGYSPLWQSRRQALNEARHLCGLTPVDESEAESAAIEMDWVLTEPALFNAYAEFKCPEPGKDAK